MNIEIGVPVKSYVKKFLISQYGSEVILFRRNDHILSTFLSLLQRPSMVFRHSQYKKIEGPKIKFVISESIKKNQGCVLPEENIVHFNLYLDSLIKNEFCRFVEEKVKSGMRTKNAIDQFCEKHDIGEEDMKYETLKKTFYRYDSIKINKNVSVNCPVKKAL